MTNEEKLYQIFPDGICPFSKVWLSEEYREPTTKNNLGVDCISRADAIKAMQDKAKKLKNEDTINGLCGAVAILFELPSVTPQELCDKCEVGNPCLYCKHEFEAKTGHWITKPHVYGVTYCSKCDFELRIDNTNYCPNCGARMFEPQESEADNGNDDCR